MTSASPKRYFLAIDGLRLFASINIVLFHLQGIGGMYDLHEKPLWLFRIIKGPAFHASIFFMLGGFIFTIKFAEKAATFDNWSFIKKRFFELYPLHLITTLAMAALKFIHRYPTGDLDVPKLFYSVGIHLSFLWAFIPFNTYALNRPSWALSAMFLCYLLFGPTLNLIVRLTRKRMCMVVALCCLLPVLLWSLLYGALGTPGNLYPFFHIFAPVRFFEFASGMVLARFFQLSVRDSGKSLVKDIGNDLMIAVAAFLVFKNLELQKNGNGLTVFLSYHFIMLPLYFVILYGLATERGFIARLLSIPVVRKTGRSSFYPYLIHIPLISCIAYICEHGFSYYKVLHHPGNVAVFVVLIYTGAYFYVNHIRKRKPTGPAATPNR
jgi:peptidoglycan/LPS O-acetylase OafA/YrhL